MHTCISSQEAEHASYYSSGGQNIMSNAEGASPRRLYHPTPVSPPHRFDRLIRLNPDDGYDAELQDQDQPEIASEALGVTWTANAAAAESDEMTFSQRNSAYFPATAEGGQAEFIDPPTTTDMGEPMASTRQLIIQPYPPPTSQIVEASPTSAPSNAIGLSRENAIELTMNPSTTNSTSSSSAVTFSTHDPPTSSIAPLASLEFNAPSEIPAGPTSASAYANYTYQPSTPSSAPHPIAIHPRNGLCSHMFYQSPPQIAPLPARSSSFSDAPHPSTCASAHTTSQQSQYPSSCGLAAATEHHSQYPGSSSKVNAAPPILPFQQDQQMQQFQLNHPIQPIQAIEPVHTLQTQPLLPEAMGSSTNLPNSHFYTVGGFPPVDNPECIGHPEPLPPLRGYASQCPLASSPIIDSPHQLNSPLPIHTSISLHGQSATCGLNMPILQFIPLSLEEEVRNIEVHSGATSFISKLWFLLSQPQEFGEYIRWTVKGKAFILSHNSPTFGETILSRLFRHANVASFLRQINLYKMQRMSQLALLEDLDDGGARVEGEIWHTGFSHAYLQRGRPELLHMIKPHFTRGKRPKKEAKASEALDDVPPPLSPGRKTRTASCSTASSVSSTIH